MFIRTYVRNVAVRAQFELEDLLLSKEVWLAVVGVVVAIAKWQGWGIPMEVFIAIQVLIVAIILALSKKEQYI